MGWSCSWVAVQTSQKAEMLEALGLVETGETVEPGNGAEEWSVGEIPGGWLVVFSEDFDWASPPRALELSTFGPSVSLQFEDRHEMASIACSALDGVELWRVSHINEDGRELVVTGSPPPAFESIRDGLMQEQATGDGVDYLHDIPIDVAKSACGYRTDEWLPPFATLKAIGAPSRPGPIAAGSGFFGFLRGLLGGVR